MSLPPTFLPHPPQRRRICTMKAFSGFFRNMRQIMTRVLCHFSNTWLRFSLLEVCFQGTLTLSTFRGSNWAMKDLKYKRRTENGKFKDIPKPLISSSCKIVGIATEFMKASNELFTKAFRTRPGPSQPKCCLHLTHCKTIPELEEKEGRKEEKKIKR